MAGGASKASVARNLNVSRMTIYQALASAPRVMTRLQQVLPPFFEFAKITASGRQGHIVNGWLD
ncbi:hypothetical protein ACC734_19070 [Rhizobium ruizarguesonis]|uniref:hypothetical protein n=1 Tax=Rhizobium ruizarguesonis TaxID=2081791 RepID=UPI001FE1B94C|nr:hypothetical protein [Rhizobium ruizarguesonis]